VIKARTWFALLIVSLGTIAATASCGSDEATGAGSGGNGGSAGGSLLTGGSASVGRAGSGGGTSTSSGLLGATCGADTDCGSGLTCITAASGAFDGDGPSLGMCTLACALDSDCGAVETGAGCINFGTTDNPNPFCFESCTQGGDATVIDTKCQGRPDFACVDFSDPTVTTVPDPFCVPRCREDLECGTGLFCDTRSGLCTKTKPAGSPTGTACNPSATTDPCAGACVGVSMTVGFCADLCSGLLPCGYSGTTPSGLCIGALSDNFGALDQGYCEPNCDCTSECQFPGDLCRAWETSSTDESSLASALGSPGLCFPVLDGSTELTCGEGGAGGAADAAGASTSGVAGSGGSSGAGGIGLGAGGTGGSGAGGTGGSGAGGLGAGGTGGLGAGGTGG
jgi:hypothetical protein